MVYVRAATSGSAWVSCGSPRACRAQQTWRRSGGLALAPQEVAASGFRLRSASGSWEGPTRLEVMRTESPTGPIVRRRQPLTCMVQFSSCTKVVLPKGYVACCVASCPDYTRIAYERSGSVCVCCSRKGVLRGSGLALLVWYCGRWSRAHMGACCGVISQRLQAETAGILGSRGFSFRLFRGQRSWNTVWRGSDGWTSLRLPLG